MKKIMSLDHISRTRTINPDNDNLNTQNKLVMLKKFTFPLSNIDFLLYLTINKICSLKKKKRKNMLNTIYIYIFSYNQKRFV